MIDLNGLKAKLAEIKIQENLILTELHRQQEALAAQIAECVVDRVSMVTLIEQINRVAAPLGIMAVVRKVGAERKAKPVEDPSPEAADSRGSRHDPPV